MTSQHPELRAVDPAEVEALADLWHQGWADGHAEIVPPALVRFRDRATFRARLDSSLDDCRVAGPLGAPVGFVRFKGIELDQFYVAATMRGTGFAAGLIAAAEDELRARGVKESFLYCSVGNERARRFYQKAGWSDAGIIRAEVETLAETMHLDVHRFEKRL